MTRSSSAALATTYFPAMAKTSISNNNVPPGGMPHAGNPPAPCVCATQHANEDVRDERWDGDWTPRSGTGAKSKQHDDDASRTHVTLVGGNVQLPDFTDSHAEAALVPSRDDAAHAGVVREWFLTRRFG